MRWRILLAGTGTVIGVTLLLYAAFGVTFANYDTLYALVWGRDLADGRLPDYGVELAPTPKPLMTLVGLALSPLGHAAEPAVVIAGFAALGGLGVAVFALTRSLAGSAAGVLAAAIVLTREPVLSFGLRAYADVAYVALVLAALAVHLARPRPRLVLGTLALAGLLRPEAWLLAGVYALWVWHGTGGRKGAEVLTLAAVAPVLWVLTDLIVTGDPLWSWLGTRETAAVLERPTGLDDLPLLMPRRLGEIVREPVLIAAVPGAWLAWRRSEERTRLLLACGAVATIAYAVLAAGGLPILGRYLLLQAALLVVFAAVAATAFLQDVERPVKIVGVACLFVLLAFVPAQASRLQRLDRTLTAQKEIGTDLHRLADRGALTRGCQISLPTHRPVPALALWLSLQPGELRTGGSGRATYVVPATRRAARLFILDPRDPADPAAPPAAAREVSRTLHWRVLSSC